MPLFPRVLDLQVSATMRGSLSFIAITTVCLLSSLGTWDTGQEYRLPRAQSLQRPVYWVRLDLGCPWLPGLLSLLSLSSWWHAGFLALLGTHGVHSSFRPLPKSFPHFSEICLGCRSLPFHLCPTVSSSEIFPGLSLQQVPVSIPPLPFPHHTHPLM